MAGQDVRDKMHTEETKRPVHSDSRAHAPLVLDSRQLFAERRQVQIRHGPDTYVLRLTRQGKLILTK